MVVLFVVLDGLFFALLRRTGMLMTIQKVLSRKEGQKNKCKKMMSRNSSFFLIQHCRNKIGMLKRLKRQKKSFLFCLLVTLFQLHYSWLNHPISIYFRNKNIIP
jgi:hypothetical protein